MGSLAQARDSSVEFVLRFKGPCLASGQTHAAAVTAFTCATPQSVVGADGGYLIPSISSTRAGAVHAQAPAEAQMGCEPVSNCCQTGKAPTPPSWGAL